jgi:hypothetical protein
MYMFVHRHSIKHAKTHLTGRTGEMLNQYIPLDQKARRRLVILAFMVYMFSVCRLSGDNPDASDRLISLEEKEWSGVV